MDRCIPLEYRKIFYVVYLSKSLSQLIADANFIIAKLINLMVRKYFASYSIKLQHTEKDMQCTHN
jgi:hypothetical protein